MTTAQEIDKLLNDYRAWLKDKTILREVNGSWVEITTPYLDRHNDALQIYARGENGGYLLTDDGYTIHDLEASGCNLKTEKRQDLLKMTLNGFGVQMKNEAQRFTRRPNTASFRPFLPSTISFISQSRLSRSCFLKTSSHGSKPMISATRRSRRFAASVGLTIRSIL